MVTFKTTCEQPGESTNSQGRSCNELWWNSLRLRILVSSRIKSIKILTSH